MQKKSETYGNSNLRDFRRSSLGDYIHVKRNIYIVTIRASDVTQLLHMLQILLKETF